MTDPATLTNILRAAQYLYLQKTCYGELVRAHDGRFRISEGVKADGLAVGALQTGSAALPTYIVFLDPWTLSMMSTVIAKFG